MLSGEGGGGGFGLSIWTSPLCFCAGHCYLFRHLWLQIEWLCQKRIFFLLVAFFNQWPHHFSQTRPWFVAKTRWLQIKNNGNSCKMYYNPPSFGSILPSRLYVADFFHFFFFIFLCFFFVYLPLYQ